MAHASDTSSSGPFEHWCADWQSLNFDSEHDALAGWHASAVYNAKLKEILQLVVNHSPYLARLALKFPNAVHVFDTQPPDNAWRTLREEAEVDVRASSTQAALAKALRIFKAKAALFIALADISGKWNLEDVTRALSEIAEYATETALSRLLLDAHARGEIVLPYPDNPTQDSGIIVLGMGKLGGFELNYSSDIDLIVFFERDRLNYQGRQNEQKFLNKITQDLVSALNDRTADGYVFRTDIRLRPDPASTPPAISVDAAMAYYESVGQNWERAAMIKARSIAGDKKAGEKLLKQLTPFIWRKNLDFATIQDILSIKRQISHKIGQDIQVPGHNIKLGHGGIREIEFFVQIHQLIWGGRQSELRSRATLDTLQTLVKLNHVSKDVADFLSHAYTYLRTLEHRLQMVEDQQTHDLPKREEDIAGIARFMRATSVETFVGELKALLSRVHDIFITSFNSEGLAAEEGSLVFTGVGHDPATLDTLTTLGFKNPEAVSDTIMGWHHGSRRCTRTKRSRQILTELVPAILNALSETANPDSAFLKFDAFLADLPAGVQIFSLFSSNPHLLKLIAEIMGSAPTLSYTLSRRPELLEAVLFQDFYHALPSRDALHAQLTDILQYLDYYDAAMEALRQFKHEKQFQAGVQMLQNRVDTEEVSRYLTDLAELSLEQAYLLTHREFIRQYGAIEKASFCILALGKLGSRELTFGSDIDLVFIYDVPDFETLSDGKQAHSPSVYFNRFAQRLLNALSATGANGQLYEVDTRLRPSGKQGLLAVSLQAFTHYFSELAWTFEKMAIVKARVVVGDAALAEKLEKKIDDILRCTRDLPALKHDIADMRKRVEQEFPSDNIWNVKHVVGGLMDIDFIAQMLVLGHVHDHPGLRKAASGDIIQAAAAHQLIPEETAGTLLEANRFLTRLQHILRLTSEDVDMLNNPPDGLSDLLCRFMHAPDYHRLRQRLEAVELDVRKAYGGLLQS